MKHAQPKPGAQNAVSNSTLLLALQWSEGRRLAVLLLLLSIAGGTVSLRHFTGEALVQGVTFVAAIGLVFGSLAYAGALFLIVHRANQRAVLLPVWLWTVCVVVESLLPSLGILILQRGGGIEPVQALAAPPILMYGSLILLSIMRLRPWLCVLSGVAAAMGHAALFAHAVNHLGADMGKSDYPTMLAYPVGLLVTGVAAALVASEVRSYFVGSLREQSSRRELERVQEEIDIARSIQQGLLPSAPPDIAGFEIAGWNRPADKTGGDYYDWQPLPDGRVAVVIADVAGHGLGPALLMAVCRAYARACVPIGSGIGAAVRRVNALLHGDIHDGKFVTFAVAVLDGRTGGCDLISAGHGPILIYRAAENRTEVLGGSGAPLGILEDEDYGEPLRLTLKPGDILLLITDGFVESAGSADGQLYGTERLRAFLCAHHAASPQRFIELLEAEVRAFAGDAPQNDDMTVVVARRTHDSPSHSQV